LKSRSTFSILAVLDRRRPLSAPQDFRQNNSKSLNCSQNTRLQDPIIHLLGH
jgi:hypothetical protein